MIDEAKKQLLHKVFDAIPFVQLVGMDLIELKPDEATVSMKMREELRQPMGLLHGGATASLIDTATAFALTTVLEPYESASTVSLNVHFLRPGEDGTFTCNAKVIKAGRRLSTISAEVVNENGKLIATALSTYSKV